MNILRFKNTELYNLSGYLYMYESDYKRIYICFSEDDPNTEKILVKQMENPDLVNPVHLNGYHKCLPGFFVKYNGKTQFKGSKGSEELCTLDDLKGKHVTMQVQYKNYFCAGKNGWYLLCTEMAAAT
jgi:hypothetical protein